VGKHLRQLVDTAAGQSGDRFIGAGYDADAAAMAQVVVVAEDFIEKVRILAEHVGDMVRGKDGPYGSHHAA
jgi:hypothetical protein